MSEAAFKHFETQHEDALKQYERAKTEAIREFKEQKEMGLVGYEKFTHWAPTNV